MINLTVKMKLLVIILCLITFNVYSQNDTLVTRLDNLYVWSRDFNQHEECLDSQRVYIGEAKKYRAFIIKNEVIQFDEQKITYDKVTQIYYTDVIYHERYNIEYYNNWDDKKNPGFTIFITNIDWGYPTWIISNTNICNYESK